MVKSSPPYPLLNSPEVTLPREVGIPFASQPEMTSYSRALIKIHTGEDFLFISSLFDHWTVRIMAEAGDEVLVFFTGDNLSRKERRLKKSQVSSERLAQMFEVRGSSRDCMVHFYFMIPFSHTPSQLTPSRIYSSTA